MNFNSRRTATAKHTAKIILNTELYKFIAQMSGLFSRKAGGNTESEDKRQRFEATTTLPPHLVSAQLIISPKLISFYIRIVLIKQKMKTCLSLFQRV